MNVNPRLWACMVMAANTLGCTLSCSNQKLHVIGKGINMHFTDKHECIQWMYNQSH